MDALHAVSLPVGDWLLIDSTMDNTVSVAAVDLEDTVVATGHHVREVGWAAAAAHPRKGEGSAGWPPEDAALTISLPMTHWSFVLAELARWALVEEKLGQREELEESARLERILREQLTGAP
ncbi:hypothetical protein [Cellulomonas sp. URHE0023]|uniref:hypothetical protein n=1 Tax=Cellulomonas sp. URHE0023 TaxID=1380354 RepID=UPI000484F8C2|nr:hypothetical protein [Cellulomonas sp. URHE0023]